MLDTHTPPSQTRLALVLSRLIERRGLSAKDVSLALGRGEDWLSAMLRGQTRLPIGVIEEVARILNVPLHDVFSSAFPDPDRVTDPRSLIEVLGQHAPDPSLSAERRRQIESFLAYEPRVDRIETPQFGVVQDILEQIWVDRRAALDYAVFHLNTLMGTPRRVQVFAAGLATFSDLLRVLNVNAFNERRLLLQKAYEIIDRFPDAGARAVVDEKAAYLMWNLTGRGKLVARLLEQPSLIAHPFPERLLTSRAQFHSTIEAFDVALAYCDLAVGRSLRPIATGCAQGIAANCQNQLGNDAAALMEIDAAEQLRIPQHLRLNLEAIRAKIFLASGREAQGRSSLLKVLQDRSYTLCWPDKAGYAALDFLDSSPSGSEIGLAMPSIAEVERRLNPNNRVEAAILTDLAVAVAQATASMPARLRRVVDPNG